jgi:hypothetical protein
MTSEIKESIHGRIYKIVSSETDQVYVGSTTKTLKRRLTGHKSKYNLYLKNEHHYITSFDILKFSDAKIMLIHEGLFDTKDDLRRLEGQYMLATEHCVNKCIAGRTATERLEANIEHLKRIQKLYRELNKEAIKQRNKVYHENHKDEHKQYKKEYYTLNKERLSKERHNYYEQNKEHIKEQVKRYAKDNAEAIKERCNNYRRIHQDRIKEQKGQVIECPVCKTTYTNGHKSRHERTIRHQNALSQASSSELPATDTTEYGARSQSSSSEIPAIENLTSD